MGNTYAYLERPSEPQFQAHGRLKMHPSHYTLAYDNCRTGLCRKEENALVKCELDGYVENSPRPLYEQAGKCRKQEKELKECETFVLEPALDACPRQFREYVESMTQSFVFQPQRAGVPVRSKLELAPYDLDPYWRTMAARHPEVFSSERLQAYRYGRWLYNSRVKRALDQKHWEHALKKAFTGESYSTPSRISMRDIPVFQLIRAREPFRQAFLKCAADFANRPMPAFPTLEALAAERQAERSRLTALVEAGQLRDPTSRDDRNHRNDPLSPDFFFDLAQEFHAKA